MAPQAKRRKVATAATPSTIVPSCQKGIKAFGKISKARVQGIGKSDVKKIDAIEGLGHGNSVSESNEGRKRKLSSPQSDLDVREKEEADITEDRSCGTTIEDNVTPTLNGRRIQLSRPKNTLRKTAASRKKLQPAISHPSTTLDSFLPSSPQQFSSPPSPRLSTPLTSPPPANISTEPAHPTLALPHELLDLQSLHSAFLTALSLHHAHNGPLTPADLRILSPSVAQTWGKRKVGVADIQRILALGSQCRPSSPAQQDWTGKHLSLTDYGNSTICIELSSPGQTQPHPLDENALNASFTLSLHKAWTAHLSTTPSGTAPSFLCTLPLHPILPSPSLAKLAPQRSKAHLALLDLKAGAKNSRQKDQRTLTSTSPPQTAAQSATHKDSSTTRTSSLLTRLSTKEKLQALLTPPLSAEDAARKAALQRLPEVAQVLQSLYVSRQRHCNSDAAVLNAGYPTGGGRQVSFTMTALVENLRMSLRNPIGKEEGVRCVRLVAEVCPEWVRVREVGRVVGIKVTGQGVGGGEMWRRVREVGGG